MRKKQKPASNVVVGGVGADVPGVSARNQKVTIAGAAVGIVLLLTAGTWLVWQQNNDAAKDKNNTKTVFTSVEDVYKSDAQKLDAELAAAKTPEQKGVVLVKRANAELAAARFADAESWAKKAVEAKATVEAYSVLGLAARQAGDKATAIDAYKKAATLTRQQGGEDAEQKAIRLDAAAAVLQ